LPDTIQFSNGNQIINRYDAGGRKLGTENFTRVTDLAVPLTAGQTITQSYLPGTVNQTGTAYVDNKEYTTSPLGFTFTTLNRVDNPEGYISFLSPYTGYLYYRRDHLGNNREVWQASTNTTVQRTNYYPSGLPWYDPTTLGTSPYRKKSTTARSLMK
jgi:hypothetical protein